MHLQPNEARENPNYFGVWYTPPGPHCKLGVQGLFNTPRDPNCFYQVEARVGKHTFRFERPDWEKTCLNVWFFDEALRDREFDLTQSDLHPNSCVVFKVSKFNHMTLS